MKRSVYHVNLFLFIALVSVTVSVVLSPRYSYAYTVVGDSMYPTFSDGDVIKAVRQDPSDIDYGIYVLEIPSEYVESSALSNVSSTLIMKRVIGLPGDIVAYTNGALYVNGDQLFKESDYFFVGDNLTVSDGCVYVIGDNPLQSFDSRYFGELPITSNHVYKVLGDK